MADAYRGLTIRIGGDTTKLTKALKVANQAVAGTQSELRKLSQALKLDPTSLKASQLQMGAFASQASNTAAQIVELKHALKEVGDTPIKINDSETTTIREYVEGARDIQMQAALARENFNGLNKELATGYTQLTKWSSELGSGQIFNVDSKNTGMEQIEEEFERIRKAYNDFINDPEIGEEGLKKLGFKGSIEDINALEAAIRRLKPAAAEANKALESANKNAGFEDLQAKTAQAEATMRSFVQQLVKAGETSSTMRSFGAVNQEIEKISSLGKQAEDRIKSIDAALKQDPKNPKLLADRMRAVADATEAAREKMSLIQKVMGGYDDEVKKLATSQTAIVTAAKDASAAMGAAQEKLSSYEGKVASLTKQQNKLKEVLAADPDAMTESGTSAAEELNKVEAELEEARQKVEQYTAVVESCARRQNQAWEAVEYRDLRNELDETKVHVENLGKTDGTPKVDKAGFMQALNMIAQAARRAGSEIVQSANDVDSAYRDMRKTVNATESEYEALKDAAIEYSKNSFTSADTMLEMQALGGQLGILQEDLAQLGKISSNLDIATNIQAEDVALQLGQVANVLHLDIDGMQGFSDALVRLGNNMPAQESAIMNVAQRFGAVASTANFSGAEILAWAAAIASTGQRSEMAATAIGNTVSGIEQAVAKGGKDIKAFATIAGKSAEDFAAEWQASPTKALKDFINGLHNMTESKESAVAALENMGITGVRQQQTLLGLSQTIGNLDNALAMSGNAWNQVSDQWGQAGDAANEAFKKSQGFSGSLAILQNNAQNLAASFGDGLVPLMQTAASVIGTLADTFNAMPAPLKAAYASIATFGIGMSTILPVLDMFKSGWVSLLQGLVNAGGPIGSFITSMTGIQQAANSAATGAAGFASTLGGPVMLAIAGVAMVITGIATAVANYEKEQETLRQSTEGLVNAMDAAQTAYQEASVGIEGPKKSFNELRDAIKGAVDAQATLAEELETKWANLGTEEAALDGIVSRIAKLTSMSSLSAGEQAELNTKVEAFNTMTGQSVEIVDALHGILSHGIGQIKGYANAWKESETSKLSLESYLETSKRLIENEKLLKEKTDAVGQAMKNNNPIYVDMYNGASVTATSVAVLNKEAEKLKQDIAADKEAMKKWEEQIGATEQGIKGVDEELMKVGSSLSDYGDLTDNELKKVVDAYNNTADSSKTALERIREALNQIFADRSNLNDAFGSSVAEDMEAMGKEAATQRYNDLKQQFEDENRRTQQHYDDEYKDKQRELDGIQKLAQRAADDAYKQAQRAYDAEYKQQQKAYDAEYKAAQKQMDAEYKQWQKHYDAIYDQQKKALDEQYNQQKKALDDKYNQLKKSVDKEYDEQKKSLDAVYNVQKDALDKAYKERKKQYDAQLKLLKKAQGDEVDAFKKATDAKLKEMEREYKARLKALEAEYGGKTDDIDGRIKALNAETEAEKRAIEERNQNEKIAQLRANVENAKSRRKRAEAEKALNDYLQEVEQKRNEEARKAEIERLNEKKDALKDELANRKEQLKAEYDAEVEAYKLSREQQLEALQAANEAEYTKRQEQYDLQLEQLKANQQAQLESLKETHTAELESIKEANELRLASVKEGYDRELEMLKENHQSQLDATKEANTLQLESIKEAQQLQLENLKESQQTQLEALKESQQLALENMKQGQQDEMDILKQGHQDQLADLKRSQQDALNERKKQQSEELEIAKKGTEDQTAEEGRKENLFIGMANTFRKNWELTWKGANDDATNATKQGTKDVGDAIGSAEPDIRNKSEQVGEALASGPKAFTGISEGLATEAMHNYGSGAVRGGAFAEDETSTVFGKIENVFKGPGSNSYLWGWDMLVNFGNGVAEAWDRGGVGGVINFAAEQLARIWEHTTPKEGPLKDDDEWGGHLMDNIINGMLSREGELIRQTERIASAMESAFDPTLTVDAAYEAIGSINKGRSAVASVSSGGASASVGGMTVNINFGDVSVRSDEDIDRLATEISRRMAAQARRHNAGRL